MLIKGCGHLQFVLLITSLTNRGLGISRLYAKYLLEKLNFPPSLIGGSIYQQKTNKMIPKMIRIDSKSILKSRQSRMEY